MNKEELAEYDRRSRLIERAAVAGVLRDLTIKDGEHWYLSTYCFHGNHADCRKTCKTCATSCICDCHGDDDG